MNTNRIGYLVGQLMKELLSDEEFHKGYQQAIAELPNKDVDQRELPIIKALKDEHFNTGPSAGGMVTIKVPMIKRHRELMGTSLKEAKDRIEDFMDRISKNTL